MLLSPFDNKMCYYLPQDLTANLCVLHGIDHISLPYIWLCQSRRQTRLTNRLTNWQTECPTDRQRDRHTDRHTHTHTYDWCCHLSPHRDSPAESRSGCPPRLPSSCLHSESWPTCLSLPSWWTGQCQDLAWSRSRREVDGEKKREGENNFFLSCKYHWKCPTYLPGFSSAVIFSA